MKIFESLLQKSFGGCATENYGLEYHNILFQWLDANEQVAWQYPVKCNG